MKQTRIFLLLFVCYALLASSCQKWLAVEPTGERTPPVQFSGEAGFQEALTGIYIQLKDTSLYGKILSYSAMEFVMHSWDAVSLSREQKLGNWDWQDREVAALFENVFRKQYAAIAGINDILAHLENNKSVFHTRDLYALIKFECLALRAFCHFELLRLFGPCPAVAAGKTTLPYVTDVSLNRNPRLAYEAYTRALLKDLADAEMLAKTTDPFLRYSRVQLAGLPGMPAPEPGWNSFFNCRFIRMNYYAIKGLQARLYLWLQDKEQALAAAKEIIDARNNDGSLKFPLGTEDDFVAGDRNLFIEQLFGLHDATIFNRYADEVKRGSLAKGNSELVVNIQLYDKVGSDTRAKWLWEPVLTSATQISYTYRKFGPVAQPAFDGINRFVIPLLRVSEMYLVAAEAAPEVEANGYWNRFRKARGVPPMALPAGSEKDILIAREYHREFFGEGQSFYAYKRINAPHAQLIWAWATGGDNYQVPVPATE